MQRITGMVLIAISAASFATLAIFGRLAYAINIDTYTLLFLRFGFSAILMGGLMFLRKEPLPQGKNLLLLAGMGAIGYVGQSFSYLTAIKYASAGLVALLLYLYPAIVAILSAFVLKEKINKTKIFAIAIALTGTALTVSPEGGKPLGILLGIAAAFIYSIYIIVGTDVMKKVTAIQSSTVIFFSAAFIYGILMTANAPHLPTTPAGWWLIL